MRESNETIPVLLTERLWFPDPRLALNGEHNGLLAFGGDLSVERLRLAYRSGIFPWTVNPITWWSPDPRGVFDLNEFHISRSLARTLRQTPFEITRDRDFRGVISACAQQRRRGNWISVEFTEAYTRLHEAGHAHSVECWQGGVLAGGVYGVAVGGLFAGESMFHRVSDASKVALHHLIGYLRERGFTLFDTQMVTPVTKALGAKEISREEYLQRLASAVRQTCRF